MVFAEVAVIAALIFVNGFLAGAEIAVVSVRQSRLDELAAHGSSAARAVLALRAQPERFLATVQIGITVVSAAAAAYGGASIALQLEPVFQGLGMRATLAADLALGIVVVAISYFSIVLGELVPKSLALRGAERYALAVGQVLRGLSWLARPFVWFLTSSSNLVLKPFGDSTTFTETRHSAEELHQLVAEAMQAGTVDPDAGEIASRALELPKLVASDVMVHRREVVSLKLDATPDELRCVLLEHTHSRMPVLDGDDVKGFVAVKDLLALAWEQRLVVLLDVMRPAWFVPASMRAVDLLEQMRTRHNPFAIVVDEHGAMVGVVTMEDLLEELIGEIFSERIKREPGGGVLVEGATPIRELNRALHLQLPDDGEFNTIAGLCLSAAGRIPRAGETITIGDVRVEIADASAKRIRSVRLKESLRLS